MVLRHRAGRKRFKTMVLMLFRIVSAVSWPTQKRLKRAPVKITRKKDSKVVCIFLEKF